MNEKANWDRISRDRDLLLLVKKKLAVCEALRDYVQSGEHNKPKKNELITAVYQAEVELLYALIAAEENSLALRLATHNMTLSDIGL